MAISTGTAAAIGATATVAGSVASAAIQSGAAGSAADTASSASYAATDAQLQAAREAIASNEKMFATSMDYTKEMWGDTKSMLSPYLTTGTRYLNKLNALYGVEPVAEYDPNMSVVQEPTMTFTDATGQPVTGEYDATIGGMVPAGTVGKWRYGNTYDTEGNWTGTDYGKVEYQNEAGEWVDKSQSGWGEGTWSQPETVSTHPAGEWTTEKSQAAQDQAMSEFFTSPQYEWNLSEGQKAIEQSAAAKGGLLSGQAVKDLQKYSSNLASGEFTNYVNALYQMAGFGSTAAGTGASAAGSSASTVSNAASEAGSNNAAINLYSGNAAASGYINQANIANTNATNQASIWSNALSGLNKSGSGSSWSNLLSGWGSNNNAAANVNNTPATFGSNMFNQW